MCKVPPAMALRGSSFANYMKTRSHMYQSPKCEEYKNERGALCWNEDGSTGQKGDSCVSKSSCFGKTDLVSHITQAMMQGDGYVYHPSNSKIRLPLDAVFETLDREVPRTMGGDWKDFFDRQVPTQHNSGGPQKEEPLDTDCNCEGPCLPHCGSNTDIHIENLYIVVDDDEEALEVLDDKNSSGGGCGSGGWVFV